MLAVLQSLLKLLLLIPTNVDNYFQWLSSTKRPLSQICISSSSVGSVGTVFRQYGVKYC